jgi:hypothetical protein
MLSAVGWIVAIALSFVVGAIAESWSWEGRLWLALLLVVAPHLIRSLDRPSASRVRRASIDRVPGPSRP